jgi:CheY-like chemotaxis protein
MHTRIAIADDDPSTRALVRCILRGRATSIIELASGAELCELLARREPADLLVTDIAMPWMNGLDAVAIARRSGYAVPVLIMTGGAEPTIPGRVSALGRARLVRKPFGIDELRAAVDALLGLEPN